MGASLSVPGKFYERNRVRRCGFTYLDLLILAMLAVVAAVLLPLMARPKHHPGLRCFNNLRQIDLAYQQWAEDNRSKFPAQVPVSDGGAKEWVQSGFAYGSYLVMSNELSTPKLLICREDPSPNRVVATIFSQPVTNLPGYGIPFTSNSNVSYFVGMDANKGRPMRFLAGDSSLLANDSSLGPGVSLLWTNARVAVQKETHLQKANIAFADGSVQSLKGRKFQEALSKTGMMTNRLVLP